MKILFSALFVVAVLLDGIAAQQCGWQAGGLICPGRFCCSRWGFCGTTREHCGNGCQSNCWQPQCGSQADGGFCPGRQCCSRWGFCGITAEFCGEGCQSMCWPADVASIITRSQFNQILKHRNDAARQGRGFYTYDAFIAAAKSFPQFGTTGDTATSKREIAAFLGQTSHETTGNWTDFLRFWMTPQSPKPSCHDVITGQWTPSAADRAAGRLPGYGVVTNIINGGVECGRGPMSQVADRIGFYKRFCDLLGVHYGDNLDCNNQSPFGSGSRLAMVA